MSSSLMLSTNRRCTGRGIVAWRLTPRPRKVQGIIGINLQQRRRSSGKSPFENGFIPLKDDEGLLCFTNILPTKRGRFDFWSRAIPTGGVKHIVESRCLPPELKDPTPSSVVPDFEVLDVIPRSKDGLVFMKYRPGPWSTKTEEGTPVTSREESATAGSAAASSGSQLRPGRVKSFKEPSPVAAAISEHLLNRPLKRWFLMFMTGRHVKVFDTRGEPGPWLADLRRYPSKRLRVEFISGPGYLGQQALYALCSRYGKIADIIPQTPHPRIQRRSTIVQFTRIDSAVAAKACLDGHIVDEMEAIYGKEGGVRLSVAYERISKLLWIRDMVINHPKFVVPAIIVVVVTIAIASFETARAWFVWAKVTGFPGSTVTQITAFYPAVQQWAKLMNKAYHQEGAETSMLPKRNGNGVLEEEELEMPEEGAARRLQEQLEEMLTEGWGDDTPIVVTGNPAETAGPVEKVLRERSVVFHLDFKPIAEAGSSGDAAVIHAVARQLGYPVFSSMSKVLDFVMHAITGRNAGLMKSMDSEVNSMLESAKTVLRRIALDAQKHVENGNLDGPYDRPAVVIRNISRSKNTNVYRKLEEWASDLANEHYAHVILLTNDHNIMQSRRHRDIIFNEQISPNAKAIAAKRARMSRDLQKLPEDILSRFIIRPTNYPLGWTAEQAWEIIKLFSERSEVKFEELLLSDLFQEDGESSLRALEKAGMISIFEQRGMPDIVKPTPKYHQEVFLALARDRFLAAKMELSVAKALRERANIQILQVEKELARLAKLKILPKGREEYLLKKIDAAQERLEDHERRIRLSTSNLKKFFMSS